MEDRNIYRELGTEIYRELGIKMFRGNREI
jgi:hypothetical protein